MEKLLKRAKELGIENAEALNQKELTAAIKTAEAKLKENQEIFKRAQDLGLETEGKSPEELLKTIQEAEEIAKEIASQARNTELVAMLSEYLGITDLESLTKDEIKALLEKRQKADDAGEVTPVVQEGKTDQAVKASNGKEYVFTDDAPAAFRYLGVHRTQKEWIEDQDSIDLMVAGRLSFLTFKK